MSSWCEKMLYCCCEFRTCPWFWLSQDYRADEKPLIIIINMSLDFLLLNRPSYNAKESKPPIQSLHQRSPQVNTVPISAISTPKEQPQQKKFEFPKSNDRKTLHKKAESTKSAQYLIKRARVQEAYNSLSDFNDKDQILYALRSLHTADERIQLIDKVLERKEEMQLANLRFKAKKLEPIFNVIRRKLRGKKRETPSPHSPDTKKTTIIQNPPPTTLVQIGDSDEVVVNQSESTLQPNQQAIIDKLQGKFTTSVAFSWLTGRNDKTTEVEQASPQTQKKLERRNTALQAQSKQGKSDLKQMISKKVSENSEEMIRLGKLKLQETAIKQYNPKEIVNKAKSKVDSGLAKTHVSRSPKRKPTLNLLRSERDENHQLHSEYQQKQNHYMFKRNVEV